MTEDDFESLNTRYGREEAGEGDKDEVTLTSTNLAAAAINAERLESLDGNPVVYAAQVTGEFDQAAFPADCELVVKKGAQVMMLRNDPDRRWVNGDVGTVESCDPHRLLVRVRDHTHEVSRVQWERIRYTFSHEENRMQQGVAGIFK